MALPRNVPITTSPRMRRSVLRNPARLDTGLLELRESQSGKGAQQ
jgi:hypothetical protein